VTEPEHTVGAAPSSEHATFVAFAGVKANIALVAAVAAAGADWIWTVGPGVTVHANESEPASMLADAVTTKVCDPTASDPYVIGLEHGVAAVPSSEHATADALAVENVKVALVVFAELLGVDRIVARGAGVGGGGGPIGGASGEIVHAASACADPAAFTTRTATVWAPGASPVSVSGDAHANAGGVLSSAHVVLAAPCDAQLTVDELETDGDAGGALIVTVGAVVAARTRARATCAVLRCAGEATAAAATGMQRNAAARTSRIGMRCGMGNQLQGVESVWCDGSGGQPARKQPGQPYGRQPGTGSRAPGGLRAVLERARPGVRTPGPRPAPFPE
jgi:hypothetical protein